MVDWTAYRREFPIFARKVYMNTCSLGPLSRSVRAAVEGFLAEWEVEGASAWYSEWMEDLGALRSKFASLIRARPEEIGLAPSISAALGTIASCFNYGLKPKVVLSELDFPTLAYQWIMKPQVTLDFVPTADGVTVRPEAFAEHVDIDTGIVATSHVLYTSGYIQDLRRMADIAHEEGSYLLVDAYQSAGQVPVDVRATDVDILVTGGLKWLLGGPGVVFIYVRQELVDNLEPTSTGWFANVHQFDFNPRKFEYYADARRFETGTPSVGAVKAANAGLDMVLGIGVEALRYRTSNLTEGLIAGAKERGFTVACPSRPEERSGIVMVERRNPARVVKALAERNFVVDSRGTKVRISPFFYNTPEDGEAILDAMKAIGNPA